MGGIVKSVTGAISGPDVPKPEAMKGAQFQPFGYTSLAGTAAGEKDGMGFEFSQELSPELQSLYGAGLAQAQPFLSQYLQQAQAPIQQFQDPTGGLQETTQQYFAEQQAMLDPVFQEQRQQLQSDLFGSGRLGLQLQGVQPDAAGLAESQAQALTNAAMDARTRAMGEQAQMFEQAGKTYGLQTAADQQRLANLLGGYQGALGTAQNVLGMEQGLIGQAAGLEEARARAMAGSATAGAALTPAPSGGGLFGALASGAGYAVGGPLGAAAAGMFSGGGMPSPVQTTQYSNYGVPMGNPFFARTL